MIAGAIVRNLLACPKELQMADLADLPAVYVCGIPCRCAGAAERFRAEARRALEEAGKRPIEEQIEDLIQMGVLDRNRRLTRQFGGDAEPEPGAMRYAPCAQDD